MTAAASSPFNFSYSFFCFCSFLRSISITNRANAHVSFILHLAKLAQFRQENRISAAIVQCAKSMRGTQSKHIENRCTSPLTNMRRATVSWIRINVLIVRRTYKRLKSIESMGKYFSIKLKFAPLDEANIFAIGLVAPRHRREAFYTFFQSGIYVVFNVISHAHPEQRLHEPQNAYNISRLGFGLCDFQVLISQVAGPFSCRLTTLNLKRSTLEQVRKCR